jgi:hypothetical protein
MSSQLTNMINMDVITNNLITLKDLIRRAKKHEHRLGDENIYLYNTWGINEGDFPSFSAKGDYHHFDDKIATWEVQVGRPDDAEKQKVLAEIAYWINRMTLYYDNS